MSAQKKRQTMAQNMSSRRAFQRALENQQQMHIEQQKMMPFRTYNDWTNNPRPRVEDRKPTKAELAQQQQQAATQAALMKQYNPSVPGLNEELSRHVAYPVLCIRCEDDDEDCWDCSGTGIDPIPWPEVISGLRGGP